MTVASLLRGTVGRRAFAGHGPNELGAAEAAVLRRWIVVVLACLEYSRSELRVGGENIRVRKRKRSYQFHQRWGASFSLFYSAICRLILRLQFSFIRAS